MPILFPDVSPIAFSLGFLDVRWYSLAYLFGIIAAWIMIKNRAKLFQSNLTSGLVDDFISWAVIAIIIGGRLGYVIFYNPMYYIDNPEKIIAVWDGGMSFHGAVMGLIIAIFTFCYKYKINPFFFGDLICLSAPIGLFFGRIANFINAELYGKKAPEFIYAVIFPNTDGTPRHASQIYEAGLEGVVLFIILNSLWYIKPLREKHGFFVGLFFAFYAIFRFIIEFFREPDIQLGYLWQGLTMGQILCLPMLIFGIWLISYAVKDKKRGKNG